MKNVDTELLESEMKRVDAYGPPACDWYEKAAKAIVREGVTLFQWTNKYNKGLRTSECDAIAKTQEFRTALRNARNLYYKELSTDPTRSRNTAIGQLLFVVEKLIEGEQYDKATAALAQLFRAEGWTSDAANVNIFQDMNAKDIEGLRKKLRKDEPAKLDA